MDLRARLRTHTHYRYTLPVHSSVYDFFNLMPTNQEIFQLNNPVMKNIFLNKVKLNLYTTAEDRPQKDERWCIVYTTHANFLLLCSSP